VKTKSLATAQQIEEARGNLRATMAVIGDMIAGKFVDPQGLIKSLTNDVEEFETSFLEGPYYQPDATTIAGMNAWVSNSEAKERKLSEIADVFLTHLPTARNTPGHDARHILKDAIAAIEILMDDKIDDYRQIFLIGALTHDVGRLFEKDLLGGTDLSPESEHAKISYMVVKMILDCFELPKGIRDTILFSVSKHTKGTIASNNEVQKLAATCDMMQLFGSEGLSRFWQADIGSGNNRLVPYCDPIRRTVLALPGSKDEVTMAEHAEFFVRNSYPTPSKTAMKIIDREKVVTGLYLMLSNSSIMQQQTFYPELERDAGRPIANTEIQFKKPFSEKVWTDIKEGIDHKTHKTMIEMADRDSLDTLAMEIVASAHAGITINEIENINRRIKELKGGEIRLHKLGAAYILIEREKLDKHHASVVARALTTYPEGALAHSMAKVIREKFAF